MKKRILSIVLTLAMVLSLIPAAIFAEGEEGGEGAIPEGTVETEQSTLPEAEVSVRKPITLTAAEHDYMTWPSGDDAVDRPLQIVMNFKAMETLVEAQAGGYGDWICDFYLTVTGLAEGSLVADNCYLAGNYGDFGWIVIPADGMVIENDMSYPIVAAYDANLTYENICDYVKDFTAAIYIDYELLNANPDMQVKLELKMTNPDDTDDVLTIGEPAVYEVEDLSVAKVGGKYFGSLAAAIAAAEKGDTITVLADIDLGSTTVTIPAGADITLDLNGKTISGTHGAAYGMIAVNNAADLTIKDSRDGGKITCAAGGNNVGAAIYVEGDLVLDSGSIELTGSWSLGFAVDVKPNSWSPEFTEGTTFVMNGGKVAATDTAVRVSSTSSTKHENVSASFTMNAGVIESDWDAIFIQHQGGDGVTGGHDCTVEIKAGAVSGANSPLRIYGDAAVNDVVLTIGGGTFAYTGEGTTGWVIENVLKGTASVVQDATITISGGAFTGDVSEYVVDGMQCLQNKTTGLYVVHVHGEPENVKFNWSDDYKTCVAEYNCAGCEEPMTKDCLVTIETKQPTVEETGLETYTATVEINGKPYSESKSVELPKHVHAIAAAPEFDWSADYKTCVVKYECECGENFTVDAAVTAETTKQPTVEKEGEAKYTATVEIDGKPYTEVQTVVLTKLPPVEDAVTEIPGTGSESDTTISVDHAPVVEETKKENVKVEDTQIVVPEGSDEEEAEKAAEALTEAVAEIKVEAEKIATEQAATVTVEEITEAVEKIEEKLAADETLTDTKVTNVTVETKISLEVKVEEAVLADATAAEQNETVSSLTVNITPIVTTTITGETETGAKETVIVKEKAKAEVKIPVTVTIPLPTGYFKVGDHLTVIHTKSTTGEKFYHPVTVMGTDAAPYVEFENVNGFSKFEIIPAGTNFVVYFVDTKGADITESVKVVGIGGEMDVTVGLPAGKYAVIGVDGAVCQPVVFDVAGETTVKVLSAPIFGTELGDLPAMIAVYYDAIYELAYYYADTLGYVDVAVDALEIALDSLDIAYNYVDENAPAEYEAVKVEMLEELTNTKETLAEVIDLLENDKVANVDSLIAEVLGLEDQLWKHIETLSKLGYELGLEIDPYIIKLNDAVVEYAKLVDTTVVDAYNTLVETVDGFVAAYEAWVEEMGAAADQIDPALGAAVRKFFNDSAADAVAIVAAYGEEAIFELFDVAGDAAGNIVDVALNLADVMVEYGLTIHEAIKNNAEVQGMLQALKDQLAAIEALVKEIAELKTSEAIGAVTGMIAEKEALLDQLYTELMIHHTKTNEVLYSVIADIDEEAAKALCNALFALCDTLCITYDAAEGYLGWLAGRADAMACEILCAVLDNLIELIITASPIMDNWMYNWLYEHPEEVIAFCIENEAETDALVAKYGPCVVAVLGYVANTYGPEVLDFIINNPCEALDMFMDWYNKYGYRIWPMIDVYLEALGVYDAIDEQLGIVNDKIMAMLSELDAHILAQIAALKAALLDAAGELRAQIEAEIQALYEQLMAFLKANISAYYVVGPNSYYVALGDAGAYGPAADKLAAELGMTDKYTNLTFSDATASEVLAALNAAEIAKADLITLGFGANTFTAAVAADVMNAVFGEIVEKDWAALVGEEGAAAIEAALAELTAYVAEEVEDESIADLLTAAVESFAYTYINHLVDYVVVSEAIHEINADALLVLVGMHNPMDGVVIDLDGEQLDLGEYLNYLVMLTNIYSFGYALIAEDTIYVDAPAVETNYDGAVMDIMTFVTDLLGFEEAVVKYQPTDAGYKYIQEQIYNALNPTLYEEEACQHGAPLNGKVNFKWGELYQTCVAVYVCSDCGETLTKDCDVVILETKNPTEEEEGFVKYQASVEIAGVTYTDTQTVTLAKLDAPDTGDTTMIGLYVTVMLVAAAGAVVVLKKKKNA